jgi:C-terminal processing protease CtpA/Prc
VAGPCLNQLVGDQPSAIDQRHRRGDKIIEIRLALFRSAYRLLSRGNCRVQSAKVFACRCELGLESVVVETDGLRVIKPADAGPAARAGVMAGDLITAIGDESIKGLTLEAAFRRISGPVNATIKFKIIRQKQNEPLVVAFAREPVPSHSVELQIRVADGKLVVEATGRWSILDFDKGQPTAVAVLSRDEFYVESGDHTRIAFIRDAAGKVNGAVLNPGPWEQRGALAQ